MQLISNLFAFELFKRKINATDIQFEHSEIIQIPMSSRYFLSKQDRSLRFPLFSPALASISLTYDSPLPLTIGLSQPVRSAFEIHHRQSLPMPSQHSLPGAPRATSPESAASPANAAATTPVPTAKELSSPERRC